MIGNPNTTETLKLVTLASGIKMAYQEVGTGVETLLFVHGMGSNHKAWSKNLPTLSKNYRCLAIDLPNYGGSSKESYPYTMKFLSEVIIGFVEALDLKNPILVGHSLGGQAVLRTLVDKPAISSRAILVAPAGLETFNAKEVEWLSQNYTPENIANLSEEQIRRNVAINFHQFPADAEFMIKDNMALRKAPHFKAYCEMIPQSVMGMVRDGVNAQLPEIKARVMILFGENDKLIPHPILHPDENTKALAIRESLKIPGMQLVMVENCGHFLQWERAERFNEEVMAFLELKSKPKERGKAHYPSAGHQNSIR